MNGVLMLTVLLAIFAIGEILAEKTKALLSTALAVAVILLIAFWLGLPKDIFEVSAVNKIGMILVSFLITSLGTTMDFSELARQWKTVIIGIIGVFAGVLAIILIAPLFIDSSMAIAGAPIYAGANAAALMMKDALGSVGKENLFQFCLLLLVTQNFVGIPVASALLRKEAKTFLLDEKNIGKYSVSLEEKQKLENKRRILQFPESLNKPSVIFTKLGVVAVVAHMLSDLTNGKIHTFVFALLLGVVFSQLGFLDTNILGKTGSSTFIVFVTTVVIFSNLADTTPKQILDMIFPLIVCLVLGTVGIIIAGTIIGKILKMSPYLSIAIGLTCTFGFPTTMFIPQEVSRAIGKTEEERTAILNYLSPKMLIAGFVTVTIASVFVAGLVIAIYFS
ncbi:hypothetical protein [Miniphocaeibacter massiliensis]|uniref:hypothetical protein n=1 Tax=Miniphocaeibacter massiliensis TaxID=2041841 RepID=UPI000C1C49E2|nr:hypothetical protein [Miniphocaeibacter massiliensis]